MPFYGVSGRLVIWRDGQTSSRRGARHEPHVPRAPAESASYRTDECIAVRRLYDHGAPQSLRVTLDCPNEYDAHEHDQELNGGAEGFCCVESSAEKHTSACMISKKLHRPAGARSHRHRSRTTRIPPNARTRAPPPDIPRETLGSVFCYIPSMLGPSQGVLPFKSHRIGLHRARHCFVARTASPQEDGLRGPEQRAPQATDLIPRKTSENLDQANYTARFTYPLRFARRIANDCCKLRRSGLERGPDQRGWTLTDSGTRRTAAEVTPALRTARGTALAQLHASVEKAFLELRISVFIFGTQNSKGSPRFLKEIGVRFSKLSQPTTPTGTRPTCTRTSDSLRPQPDFNEPTCAPLRDRARTATAPVHGSQPLTSFYRTRSAQLISGKRSFGKGKRTATLTARKSLPQPLALTISKPLEADSSREARTHRSEWRHGQRGGTGGPFGSHESACRSVKEAARTGCKPKASRSLVQLPPHASSVQRYLDERAGISSGSRAARSTTDTLGQILKREQTAPASQSTAHGSGHAGKP